MKLTGEMLYNALLEVLSVKLGYQAIPLAEAETTQSFYDLAADYLNRRIGKHQTQLPAEQYHTRVEVFTSECNNPFPLVQNAANKWLSEHPEAVLIGSHVNVVGSNPAEFTITLVVELPVEQPGD